MSEIKLVDRKDVEEKYTWDMTLLYKTDKDFKTALEHIQEKLVAFKKNYENQLADIEVLIKLQKHMKV